MRAHGLIRLDWFAAVAEQPIEIERAGLMRVGLPFDRRQIEIT